MFNTMAYPKDLRVRVLGIDPGTQTLGYSLGIVNFETKQYEIEYANSISITDIVQRNYGNKIDSHSKNIAMTMAVYNFISSLTYQFQPDWVICESPYMNSRFPLPYALLTLCTNAIQTAVKDNSTSIEFTYVDPASAKNNVGVKGNNGDKNLMAQAVLNHPLIKHSFTENQLDEHAIDSIAIGFTGYKNLL